MTPLLTSAAVLVLAVAMLLHLRSFVRLSRRVAALEVDPRRGEGQ